MSVFIIQDQHQQFLTKDNTWVSSVNGQVLFRSKHYDEALNHLFEVNSKNFCLRAVVVACDLDNKGTPILPTDTSTHDSAVVTSKTLTTKYFGTPEVADTLSAAAVIEEHCS